MDINKLLTNHECSCGRTHTCEIKEVIIKKGAVAELERLVENYNSIVVAADENTYRVCGETVVKQLGEKCERVHIFVRDGVLIPNEDAIAELEISDKTDLIIGVGSGVMQDLCKYVSYENKLPYYIVATAPSMDGYASKGAAMITGNMKVTYNAHVPEVIIGDTDVLKNAPMEMIQSGYGDILGKFSCLNDWKLSAVVNGEYFCQYIYDLTFDMLAKTKDLGPRLLKRDPEAVQILSEALIGVGIAMAYAGNSRPASGSEHHLSHFFEVTGIMEGKPYFMHGTDVAYSAVQTQMLREKLLKHEKPSEIRKFDRNEWESKIRKVYSKAAEGVIELQNKLGWYESADVSVYRDKWEEICDVLREAPSSKKMKEYLKSVGLDIDQFIKMYGEEKIENAIFYAKDLKDRYSVLWTYYFIV